MRAVTLAFLSIVASVAGDAMAISGPQRVEDTTLRAPPGNIHAFSRQLRVDLSWDAAPSAVYQVQRAASPNGPFALLPDQIPILNAYSDFIGTSDTNFFYRVRAVWPNGTKQPASSNWSEPAGGKPLPLDPDTLVEDIQESAFRYFYDYAHPVSGLPRVSVARNSDYCSIGGTGWALYNLIVGADRNFITRQEAVERTAKILRFLDQKADRFHGAFPHWLNGATGKVIPFSKYDDGADLVETAFLMEGMLAAREYFSGNGPAETDIRRLADNLWRGVEWNWFGRERNGHSCLFWHWSPDYGWKKNHGIAGFNECQIVYILALASPTHAVDVRYYWEGWESTNYATDRTAFGIPLKLGKNLGPPLFWTEYSYMGFDPHRISFYGRTYFKCFQDFCRVQVRYAESKSAEFKGYGPLWGLTASRGPKGYRAFAPGPRDNGTITPSAALSSMPYVPAESRACLLAMYQNYGRQLWGPFGFYDAFNPTQNWVAHDYLGNEVGPIAPMIENYRSGLCWKTFMKATEIQSVLKLLASPAPARVASKHL